MNGLKFAVQLLENLGFQVVAALALAFGIGAETHAQWKVLKVLNGPRLA